MSEGTARAELVFCAKRTRQGSGRRDARNATRRAVAAGCSLMRMRWCVIAIAVSAITLDDRRTDG
jgi:hypothetical protein